MTELTDLNDTDALNTEVSSQSTEGNVANMGGMDNLFQATLGMLSRFRNANIFRLRDNTDKTKLLAFDLSGITTATTRTVTVPDKNVRLENMPTLGTAGQSLRVNSGATDLEYQTGWETVAQGAFSAVSALDLTGASAYTRMRISVFFTPSADGVAVTFRTRTGGSVDTGASDYDYLRIFAQAGAVGTNTSTGAGAVPLTLSNVGNAANEAMHVTINLEQFNKSSYMWATFTSSETASDGTRAIVNGEFRRLSTTARDGFSIAPGSGTITGNYMVEGMRG